MERIGHNLRHIKVAIKKKKVLVLKTDSGIYFNMFPYNKNISS